MKQESTLEEGFILACKIVRMSRGHLEFGGRGWGGEGVELKSSERHFTSSTETETAAAAAQYF